MFNIYIESNFLLYEEHDGQPHSDTLVHCNHVKDVHPVTSNVAIAFWQVARVILPL